MKRLTATICLTLAVLLGSAGMNYASSKDLTQETEKLPYWAGHEQRLKGDNGNFFIEMKYSKDGTSYNADIEITGAKTDVFPSCTGEIDKNGNLEEQDCTPPSWKYERILGGHVTEFILEDFYGSPVTLYPTATFIDEKLKILKTKFERLQQEENK